MTHYRCPRCDQIMDDPDCAEGCRDPDCPAQQEAQGPDDKEMTPWSN